MMNLTTSKCFSGIKFISHFAFDSAVIYLIRQFAFDSAVIYLLKVINGKTRTRFELS